MTQRELMEQGIDVQRGQERLNEIINQRTTGAPMTNVPGNQPSVVTTGQLSQASPKPPRRTRSDKGVKKGPKVQDDVPPTRDLITRFEAAYAEFMRTEGIYRDARAKLMERVDSLTAK